MGKKVLLGTVVGFIALMLFGYLIFGLALRGTMEEMFSGAGTCLNMEMDMTYIALASAVQALLMTLILYKFGVTTFQKGLLAAAWVGALFTLTMGLWYLGSWTFYGTSHLMFDLLTATIHGALAGGFIGWTLGKVK